MKCKKHLHADLSSSVGVCASCLRERLFALIAAQAQAEAEARVQHAQEDRRKSDPQPAPLVFPRSVSPYVSRRKSDVTDCNHRGVPDRRFFSTPQIGPAGAVVSGDLYKKQRSAFSLFGRFLRSKSKRTDADPDLTLPHSRNSSTASSSSWFSGMFSGRRKKKESQMSSLDESADVFARRKVRYRDRGMSPARVSDCADEADCYGGSSGYSSESSQGWKQTPRRAAARTRRIGRRPGHSRNVSGFGFCLSPLVRASPNQHWNQKGIPPEMAFAGEIRAPQKPPLATAAKFRANRSRKLADFGRSTHNY
ncbi:hypothetical protein NMG60_11029271 [Bertholletia excelsa]